MYDHIRFAIAVYISKLGSNGCQILSITEKGRAVIDTGLRGIATGHFNDDHVAVQIEKDKMRRVGRAVIMTDYRVNLKCARATIGYVLLVHLPPGTDRTD